MFRQTDVSVWIFQWEEEKCYFNFIYAQLIFLSPLGHTKSVVMLNLMIGTNIKLEILNRRTCDNYVPQWWVELVVYFQYQNFLSYLQTIDNPSQNFCYSHSLSFHVSGSPEFVSKQPTQLIVQLNPSLRHIVVTKQIRCFIRYRYVECASWREIQN